MERERKRIELQTEFDASKTQAERNRLGQFATPPDLARGITTCAVTMLENNAEPIHFCDPCFGTGSFYSALVDVVGRERIKTAVGIEIDAELARIAKAVWADDPKLNVFEGDFVDVINSNDILRRPNLILTNPPYVRHHHLGREYKSILQNETVKTTGFQVNGLAGLYVYFLLLATAWMEDRGLAAWLIPSEFFYVNYGEVLKKYLTEQVTLIRMHRFDAEDVQFQDALVTSAVVFFRKTQLVETSEVLVTVGGSLTNPEFSREVSIKDLRTARRWSPFVTRSSGTVETIGNYKRYKFADFFQIKRGIATGCNKVFILRKGLARELELPSEFLKPILPSPRHLRQNIIEAADDGYPEIETPLAVIDCGLTENVVQEKYPRLWEYLSNAGRNEKVLERYLVRKRNPWYKQERRDPSPFVCTYMGRSKDGKKPFRFIWNQSSAIATNLYLMLYPKGRLGELVKLDPGLASGVFDYLINISADDLREAGRVYGGGLHKMEPGELGYVSAEPLVERVPELITELTK